MPLQKFLLMRITQSGLVRCSCKTRVKVDGHCWPTFSTYLFVAVKQAGWPSNHIVPYMSGIDWDFNLVVADSDRPASRALPERLPLVLLVIDLGFAASSDTARLGRPNRLSRLRGELPCRRMFFHTSPIWLPVYTERDFFSA